MQKNLKRTVIVFSACLFLVGALVTVYAQSTKLTTGKAYKHPIDKFSIKIPKGWGIDESGADDTRVIFYGINKKGEESGVRVDVVISDVDEGFKIERDFEEVKKGLAEEIPEYRFISDKPFKLSAKELKAHLFEGTIPVEGINMHIAQLMVSKGKKLYIVSGGVQSSDWKKYSKTFNKIFGSFRP